MEDPWGSNCFSCTRGSINQFEDSFIPEKRLPDSQQYLEHLGIVTAFLPLTSIFKLHESSHMDVYGRAGQRKKKLKELKGTRCKDNDLLKALSKTKQSHLERIVETDSSQILNDPDFDQRVVSSTLQRFLAPEKQANTIGELYELIKYDQLGQLFEGLEKEKS